MTKIKFFNGKNDKDKILQREKMTKIKFFNGKK
jgi:hypothetical protein